LLNSTGELEFAAKRCVQCGEVVDPVILRNRQLRQDSMTIRLAGRICPNNCVTEGP
jgi:dissimilatory sulfite reductase (desulfoviridin) alpha/beta subunit